MPISLTFVTSQWWWPIQPHRETHPPQCYSIWQNGVLKFKAFQYTIHLFPFLMLLHSANPAHISRHPAPQRLSKPAHKRHSRYHSSQSGQLPPSLSSSKNLQSIEVYCSVPSSGVSQVGFRPSKLLPPPRPQSPFSVPLTMLLDFFFSQNLLPPNVTTPIHLSYFPQKHTDFHGPNPLLVLSHAPLPSNYHCSCHPPTSIPEHSSASISLQSTSSRSYFSSLLRIPVNCAFSCNELETNFAVCRHFGHISSCKTKPVTKHWRHNSFRGNKSFALLTIPKSPRVWWKQGRG